MSKSILLADDSAVARRVIRNLVTQTLAQRSSTDFLGLRRRVPKRMHTATSGRAITALK